MPTQDGGVLPALPDDSPPWLTAIYIVGAVALAAVPVILLALRSRKGEVTRSETSPEDATSSSAAPTGSGRPIEQADRSMLMLERMLDRVEAEQERDRLRADRLEQELEQARSALLAREEEIRQLRSTLDWITRAQGTPPSSPPTWQDRPPHPRSGR